jgi:hypothetical protein
MFTQPYIHRAGTSKQIMLSQIEQLPRHLGGDRPDR